MLKCFKNLFLLFGIVLIIIEASAQDSRAEPVSTMEAVVALARNYRLDSSILPEDEIMRKQGILAQLPSVIPLYLEEEELSAAISCFLNDVFGESARNFNIEDAATTEVRGKSKDPVFFIKDSDGHLQFIVKAFREPLEPTSKFLPEISALDFLMQLEMPGMDSVRPLAAAMCLYKDRQLGLLLETAAKGKRMDRYILELFKYPKESEAYQRQLGIALHAFERMGESLARLHGFRSDQPQALPQEYLDKMTQKYQEVIGNPLIVRKLTDCLDFGAFQNLIEQVIEKAKEVPVYYSYRHGDAHLGNMIYDCERDLFTFIDVAKLHYAIGGNGEPLSDGAQEFVRAEESLRKNAIGLLTEEETEALAGHFKQAYEMTAQTMPDQRTITFSKTYRKLGRLINYVDYEESVDPVQFAKEKELFTQAIDYFIQQVEKPATSFH